MINGIKPEPSIEDFDSAMDRLVENIHKDFQRWSDSTEYSSVLEKAKITIKSGFSSKNT